MTAPLSACESKPTRSLEDTALAEAILQRDQAAWRLARAEEHLSRITAEDAVEVLRRTIFPRVA